MSFSRRTVLIVSAVILIGCLACDRNTATAQRFNDPNLYGSAFQGDALGNVPLAPDLYGGRAVSFRFRASKSGNAAALTYYNQYRSRGGYGKGDGGTILIELRTDDATANHWPSNVVLASFLMESPLSVGYFPMIRFDRRPFLEAGRLYHIVFSNTHPMPVQNYVSLNCVHHFLDGAARNAGAVIRGRDCAVLVKSDLGSTWRRRYQSTPVFNLFLADNRAIGQGYISGLCDWAVTMNSDHRVREAFTVRGVARRVLEVFVRVSPHSGDLTVSLESRNGNLIEQGVAHRSERKRPTRAGYGMTWYSYKFRSAHTLEPGKHYSLVLYSKDGSYSTFGLLKGSRYDFSSETLFADGWAQYSPNGGYTWLDYNYAGRFTRDVDLQFYFTLAEKSGASP